MKFTALCQPSAGRGKALAKTLRVMRWTAILILAASLHTSANGYSQTITLTLSNAPLEKVFHEIENQTEYNFVYTKDVLKQAGKVNITVKNASIDDVLRQCFKDHPLTYTVVEKVVIVKVRENEAEKKMIPQPEGEIRGKVTNENGEPVEGATVMVNGSNKITLTTERGEFTLRNIPGNSILSFSSIGYETQKISISNEQFLSVKLKKAVQGLDAAVVIAYGATSQRLNTGSVSRVTGEEIAKQPVSNPLAAMEGRVPGLFITQQTGVPGGAFTVQLRGQNSIASGNNPLYIIDGIPFTSTSLTSTSLSYSIIGAGNPLNEINPSDIESIEVLKDADATAIYGSRGANGVVLITTKKGKPGKTQFDFNAYAGTGKVTRTMKMLNTQQYLQMRHEAFNNDGEAPGSANPDYDLLTWDTTRYTNWQKALFGGNAAYTDVEGTISGGSNNTQFLLSGGFHKETTVFPGDFADQKGSVHFNLNHSSDDERFKILFSTSYTRDNNNLFSYDITGYMNLSPDAPSIYDNTGKLNWDDGRFSNPFSSLLQKYKAGTSNLISNFLVSYQLFPRLQIKVSGGYTKMQMDEVQTNPLSSFNPAYGYTSENTYSFFANNSIESWIIEPQIGYNSDLGGGKLDMLIGSTFQQDLRQGQTIQGTGFSSEALMEDLAAASQILVQNSIYSKYRYNAFFGRINYNWRDKYILNFTGRRDGSSRFGPDRQFANFGAIGAGWIYTKEKFISNFLPFLSFGKIRASYGTTGNDQISDYQYLSSWGPTVFPYQGVAGLQPLQLFNPDYSWEINRKIEAALEFGILKDRIFFSASWYRNRSSNQLVGYPLSAVSGFSFIQSNLPALVQNTGFEFVLNTINIKHRNFTWNTFINLTIPRNKLISFPYIDQTGYSYIYVVGKSLFVQKRFHYVGVDPQTGIYQFQSPANGHNTFSPVYPDDLQSLKEIAVDYYGGIRNEIIFREFELDLFIQFVKQTGRNYLSVFLPPGTSFNQPTYVLQRWQKPGDQTNVQKFTQDFGSDASTAFFNSQLADNSISDASFIRVKNISLSYQLPVKWKRKAKMNNCRIYIQGQNLLTITKFMGIDPETQIAILPPLRVVTAGIHLTF